MGRPILSGSQVAQSTEPPTNYWSNFMQPQWEAPTPNPVMNPLLFRANSQIPEYPDNPIFVLIRAAEKRNIDIAQSSRKWVFSPQTEKKVIHYAMKGKKIYLVYFVNELQIFMGIAEYKSINMGEPYSKPTAFIEWIFMNSLVKYKTRYGFNTNLNFNQS